jgi:hypothetical protein
MFQNLDFKSLLSDVNGVNGMEWTWNVKKSCILWYKK